MGLLLSLLLTCVLIVLKATGLTALSWWWVLSPFPIALVFLFLLMVLQVVLR